MATAKEQELREQRNRFLAFSFATADLLIEIDKSDKIVFALGAAMAVTGIDPEHLKGRSWLNIFDPAHHEELLTAQKKAAPGLRVGPFDIRMDEKLGDHQHVMVTAIKMPDDDHFYLSIGFPKALMKRPAREQEKQKGDFEHTKTIPEEKHEFDRTESRPEEPGGEFDRTTALTDDPLPDFEPTQALPDDDIADFGKTETKKEPIAEFDRTTTIEDKAPTFTAVDAPVNAEDDSSAPPPPEEKSKENSETDNTDDETGDDGDQPRCPPRDRAMDKDCFLSVAGDTLNNARTLGQEMEMTLLEIPDASNIEKKIGADSWENVTQHLYDFLRRRSVDGEAAAALKESRYTVIHDKTVTSQKISEEANKLIQESLGEQNAFTVTTKAVSADLEKLSARETTKALIYTINEFERKGISTTIDTLNSSFNAYVTANAQKIQQFKSMIKQLNFDFHFHPIVNMGTLDLSHYEIITRFKGEESTHEWIIFGEDLGMAAEMDMAICERAINYLLYKAAGGRTKYAVNLSSQSMQNEQFFKTLMAKLALHKELSRRLIFEITETTSIDNFALVNHFIKALQKEGFTVCLDDFGSGASSFQYINELDIDFIKLEGEYTRKLLQSERDRVMVKNIRQICEDMNITMIAERIETEKQMNALWDMGITLGQGFLFGAPGPWPDYDKSKLAFKPLAPENAEAADTAQK